MHLPTVYKMRTQEDSNTMAKHFKNIYNIQDINEFLVPHTLTKLTSTLYLA